MIWQDCICDGDLNNNELFIFANVGQPNSITADNLEEIISAIRNGIEDSQGRNHSISKLTFTQVGLQDVNINDFRKFFQQLLQISNFSSLDFGVESTYSPALSTPQTVALAQAVSQSQGLMTLKVKVQDSQESAESLANMLSANRSLLHLYCNITDDAFGYAVLKAALTQNTQLNTLELPYTALPMFEFPVPPSQIVNNHLAMKFESNKSRNSATIVRQAGVFEQQGQHDGTVFESSPSP